MKNKYFKYILSIISFVFFSMLFVIKFFRYKQTKFSVTKYNLISKKIKEKIKIINLSDLHMTEFGIKNDKLIEKIKEELPDIIIMSGDMCNSTDYKNDVVIHLCKELIKIAPIYYVLGNHELSLIKKYDLPIIKDLREINVNVLDNEEKEIVINNNKIQICGITDEIFENNDEILEDFYNSKNYKLLITHRPETYKLYIKENIDLGLAAHAHGGQIILPIIGPLYSPGQGLFPKYTKGINEINNNIVIINRGLGNHSSIPRINNTPEILSIIIKQK